MVFEVIHRCLCDNAIYKKEQNEMRRRKRRRRRRSDRIGQHRSHASLSLRQPMGMKRKSPSTNAIRVLLYEPTTGLRMTGIAKVPANQRAARGSTLRGSLHPLIMTRADLVQGPPHI